MNYQLNLSDIEKNEITAFESVGSSETTKTQPSPQFTGRKMTVMINQINLVVLAKFFGILILSSIMSWLSIGI